MKAREQTIWTGVFVAMGEPTLRWTLALSMATLMASLLIIEHAQRRVTSAQRDANIAKHRLEAVLKGEEPKETAEFDPAFLVHPPATGLLVATAAVAFPASPAMLVSVPFIVLGVPVALFWVPVVGLFWYGIGFLADRRLSNDPEFTDRHLHRVFHIYFFILQCVSPLVLFVFAFRFVSGNFGFEYWSDSSWQFMPWYEDRNLWYTLTMLAWSVLGTSALLRNYARRSRTKRTSHVNAEIYSPLE
ncbi:MAG TPA: hypothetical protein VD837_04505 [Terriglobales bacterium]|nr:hypothetical protein [Terriglobales bacterium]